MPTFFKKGVGFLTDNWKKGVAGLTILGLGLTGANYLKGNGKNLPYKMAQVKLQDVVQTVSASGKVSSEEMATLRFQTSGRLSWVGVKEGDRVIKWQALASLDKRELEKKLKQELLDYQDERWDFEQTQEDYQDAALTEAIRRTKDQGQFDLDRVVLDVELADIALKYATLFSPIEGIVVSLDAPHAGVNVTPTTAEIIIANPSKMVLIANIDEADIGKIKEGQKALVLLDAYPEEQMELRVSKIGFDATTTAGGGTAFPVEFSLPAYEGDRFKLGMNGEVEIVITEVKDVLTVPFESVQEDMDGNFVYVLKENKPVKQRVEIGFSNDVDSQVLTGLGEGDEIIVSGVSDNFLK